MTDNGSVVWRVRGRTLGPSPFFVVGIVNVTPDSFYDGGQFEDVEAACARSVTLLEQGADILDIGGESTRPFAVPVARDEELRRVLPVASRVLATCPDAVLSVDTVKADVARAALEAGCAVVNDVSGLADPKMPEVLAGYKPGYVLTHTRGDSRTMQIAPQYDDVIGEILRFFEDGLHRLTRAGLPEECIALDPGIGFGKTCAHNLEILRNVRKFFSFGRPVFMALSNKSLWKDLLGREGRERNAPTLAATVSLYMRGVRIHRVHEVRETKDALRVVHMLER